MFFTPSFSSMYHYLYRSIVIWLKTGTFRKSMVPGHHWGIEEIEIYVGKCYQVSLEKFFCL